MRFKLEQAERYGLAGFTETVREPGAGPRTEAEGPTHSTLPSVTRPGCAAVPSSSYGAVTAQEPAILKFPAPAALNQSCVPQGRMVPPTQSSGSRNPPVKMFARYPS